MVVTSNGPENIVLDDQTSKDKMERELCASGQSMYAHNQLLVSYCNENGDPEVALLKGTQALVWYLWPIFCKDDIHEDSLKRLEFVKYCLAATTRPVEPDGDAG